MHCPKYTEMSDWSYRHNKPRSQVHYEKYGSSVTPTRRGMGGSRLGNPNSIGLWLLASVLGTMVVTYLLRKK